MVGDGEIILQGGYGIDDHSFKGARTTSKDSSSAICLEEVGLVDDFRAHVLHNVDEMRSTGSNVF